jgi:uncharacterized membrane protein YgdD (TMEM256/DUF423 family)
MCLALLWEGRSSRSQGNITQGDRLGPEDNAFASERPGREHPTTATIFWQTLLPMNPSRFFLFSGAVLAALWVALSAAASHVPALQAGGAPLQASLSMHQFHALGLLLLGLLARQRSSAWLWVSGGWMLLGLLLFCANIDARILWGWDAARALVPVGGSAFILAWLTLAASLLRPAH